MLIKNWCILVLLLSGIHFTQAQSTAEQWTEKHDLVYTTIGNWQGKLDLYLPKSRKKTALVVYVHGGGWTHGKKEDEYDKFSAFIEQGIAVANIEYRLANQAVAPAAIEDVYCALAYVQGHAAEFNINKKKIIIMGGSAGAHLALMVGLQSTAPVFTGHCKASITPVAGIISKYGPTNLRTWPSLYKTGSASAAWLGTGLKDTSFIDSLSPVNYTGYNKIPVLIIHGDEDKTVPIAQSELLYNQLKQTAHPVDMYVVKQGKHSNFTTAENDIINKKMVAFVKKLTQ